MKNITALAILVIIISAFFANNSLHCQEKNYGFSIGPQFGFVHGQALEIVYPVPGDTKGELLSELRWDMKPVYYFGVQIDFMSDIVKMKTTLFNFSLGLFSSLSFKAGIPADSGIMENRDWRSIENSALTDFSSHTNRTNQFFMLDAVIGAILPVTSFFYFKPFISVSWMHFSFTGRDGYGEYARWKNNDTFYPIDDGPEKWTFSGDVINYEQNWYLLAPGLSAGIKFHNFTLDFSFKTSILTYSNAIDEHIQRKTFFYDYTGLGLFIEPAVNISYTIRWMEFTLETAYRHISKTRGITHINENNSGLYLANEESGAGFSVLDTRFLVKIRF